MAETTSKVTIDGNRLTVQTGELKTVVNLSRPEVIGGIIGVLHGEILGARSRRFEGCDGCSTGDCPHDNVNDCVQCQAKLIAEMAADLTLWEDWWEEMPPGCGGERKAYVRAIGPINPHKDQRFGHD